MQPKTEELLNLLLWSADRLFRPTFRNLTDSYEGWVYRNGFSRQVHELEKRHLLESARSKSGQRLYRLTEEGRLRALGGRDPAAAWTRSWDGKWRLALFDVPTEQHVQRNRLRRYLRARGFGCLQGSVWVTPHPMELERDALAGERVDVKSLLLMEARPCSGEQDCEIVAGAWDFKEINRRYARHLEILDKRPVERLDERVAARALQRWAAEERESWHFALHVDPLLPKKLLPETYLGCQAWQRRVEILGRANEQVKTFSPSMC